MIISIEKQTWYGIGLAHIFCNNNSKAILSIPLNTKEELKELKATYPKAKVQYQIN